MRGLLLLAFCVGLVDSFVSQPVQRLASPPSAKRIGVPACMSGGNTNVPHTQGRRASTAPLPLSPLSEVQDFGLSRRQALALPLAGLLWGAMGVQDAKAVNFTKIVDGDGGYSTPGLWVPEKDEMREGVHYIDPVAGRVVTDIQVLSFESERELKSIEVLGKIEKIKLSRQLGLEKELDVADLVQAQKRKGKDGLVYYDFDLASAPKTCSREKEMLTGSCMYDKIVLVSAWAKNTDIVVLRIEATADEWKANGPILRSLRQSFIADPK